MRDPPAAAGAAAVRGRLFLCLFERRYRATRGVFFLLSTALALGAGAYALFWGAGLWETAAALLPFLLLSLGVGV